MATRLFTGKERDAETGLDYFGARYYRPDLGRFTTVDPLWGVEMALSDPQRWNRYGYVGNNPLSRIDPDGRIWVWASNLSKAQVEFLQKAIAEAIRRDEARTLFLEIADSPIAITIGVESLNSSLMLDNLRNGITTPVSFGRLRVSGEVPTGLVLDRNAIREFLPRNRQGAWVFLHELYHAAHAVKIGTANLWETDWPNSETGLASQFADWQMSIARSDLLSFAAAMCLLNQILPTVLPSKPLGAGVIYTLPPGLVPPSIPSGTQ